MASATFNVGGRTLPRIGFGALGLSQSYGICPHEQGIATLKKALSIGCSLWDTADIYANGANEKLIAEVLREGSNREKVFLVTKWGFKPPFKIVASAEYAPEALNASIKRLETTPDAWILHRVPKDQSIESVVEAMAKLQQEGKTKFIGIGECSASTLERASKVAKIDFIESEYSPFCLDIEKNGVLEACEKLNVHVLAFSPLGKGFLTGRFKSAEEFGVKGDIRLKMFPRLSRENFDKNFKIVEELERAAKTKGCTSGQLALSWALHQSPVVVPIPGTKTEKYLVENFDATKVQLSKEELYALRGVIEANQPIGDRYTPVMQDLLDL